MTRWVKLAKIKRLNNDGDLVAVDATGSLSYEELSDVFNNLCNKTFKIVPPMLENSNKLDINCAVSKPDHICLSLSNKINKDTIYEMKGRYIIVNQNDIVSVFGINLPKNSIVGMNAFDKKKGYLGNVVDIRGSKAQMCMSIKAQNCDVDILVPYVDKFVKKIEGNNVYLELSEDLINLNNG